MNRMALIYIAMVVNQFYQQQTMSVLIIQKQMIVQQQAQLNNIFQNQRDGILIYSKGNTDMINIEMNNEAFNKLVNVNCLVFNEDSSNDSHFDDSQFVL